MTSTPIAVINGQQRPPLEVLVSPQAGHHRRIQKRLSSGFSVLRQSPNLPEVEENDSKSARQRRHSRNFTAILHSSKTPSKASTSEDTSEARSGFRWSKDQLLQHYSQCMKLSQENKINHKNAFDLQLIEHMGEMIRQDGALNFRVAGGTIFAGAKIYASRVDAIHSEIFRVLSSLGSGDKDDNPLAEEQGNEDPEKKTRKRKKTSKILETNEASLRIPLINSYGPMDAAGRSRGNAIDAASCDSVMANQIELCDNEAILQQDSNLQLKQISDSKSGEISEFHSISSSYKTGRKSSSSKLICDTFNDLRFDVNALELDFADTASSEEEALSSQADPIIRNLEEDFDNTIPDVDDLPGCDTRSCDGDDDSAFCAPPGLPSQPNVHEKPLDMSHAPDIAQLVAAAPPGEYSYFKPSVLSVCDGPAHWLRHKSARSVSSVPLTQGDPQNNEGSLPKKRKTAEKSKKFESEKLVTDKKVQPQKMSKSRIESLRMGVQDQLFLEGNNLSSEMIQRAMEVKVVLRQLNSALIRQENVTVSNEPEVVNFNYNNDDYCPASVDSDYDDDAQNDNSRDMFQNSGGFFHDFTQNMTGLPPVAGEDDYNAMLEGDHLISQPRKVEKIQVHFAKHAKRIDVRRLKSAMWSMIKVKESDDLAAKKVADDGNDVAQPTEDSSSGNKNEDTTKDQSERSDSSVGKESQLFSDLYQALPNNISKNMWSNMSVPLAFTCLLHLANEKQLKIEGTSTLNDLKISQGL